MIDLQTTSALTNSQDDFLKEIEQGKYRNYYLIYNRKSTDEPENQRNSISYQKKENLSFLKKQRLPLATITITGFCTDGMVSEKHSGYKEGNDLTITRDGMVQYRIERPKFYRLVHYLSLGLFRGVVSLSWDRISRNDGDHNIIKKLMKRNVDFHFTYATYDDTSSGALHRDIDSTFATHHSRVTSEKVTLAIRKSRDEGKCTTKAPLGYLNEGNMDWKPFDPVRAPVIKRMFELYSTGEWSLRSIAQYANKQGLTTIPRRKRRTNEEILADDDDRENQYPKIERMLSPMLIHKIFSNPFYIGLTQGNNGEWIPSSSHEPMISAELFAQVKKILKKKNTSIHYTRKLHLPHRGLVRCMCGRAYSPYVKKGILYYYSRCPKNCNNSQKNITCSFIENIIGENINKLILTPNELEELDLQGKSDFELSLKLSQEKKFEEIERITDKLNQDLKYLHQNKLSLLRLGAYTPETYILEEERLFQELNHLSNQEKLKVNRSELIEDIVKLSELVKRAYSIYINFNSYEKECLIRNIFSELIIYENRLETKYKTEFEFLNYRFVNYSAPIDTVSELLSNGQNIMSSIKFFESIVGRDESI